MKTFFKKNIWLAILFCCLPINTAQPRSDVDASPDRRLIKVNARKVIGTKSTFFNHCVSTGRAYLLLRKDLQEHILKAAQECGFKYLRFHGLFQDDLGVYRENAAGEPIYSWQYADKVYDFIYDAGLRPFVVFDFMPEALSSGQKHIYWERSNITPPKDYEKWGNLIYETVRHFTERYGEDEVSQWYFEVWNEPDKNFFTGTIDEYMKMYEAAARAVKSVSEHYRIGGPSIAGDVYWIEHLIKHCEQNDIPVDFISAHTYSATTFSNEKNYKTCSMPSIPQWTPGPAWPLGNLKYDANGTGEAIEKVYETVRQSSMPDIDIHYTEWGLTWDYWDPLRDVYQAPSFILSRMKSIKRNRIQSLSYCMVSDVFEEDGPPTDYFHGGFGLLNLQGLRKPAYFAYKFFHELDDVELECLDNDAIACGDGRNVQVLLWDCTVRQNKENKVYYKENHPALPAQTVRVDFSELNAGKYALSIYRVGYRSNDVYTFYSDLKKNSDLTREQVKKLDEMSCGLPEKQTIVEISSKGNYSLQIPLKENDVCLIKLEQL